ncbi:hypothetical protein Tco_1130925, partial [Tanacetum coccineum]
MVCFTKASSAELYASMDHEISAIITRNSVLIKKKRNGSVLGDFAWVVGWLVHWLRLNPKKALHSGFHEAYKLHFPTNSTTTPPFTSTDELIHDCNPINTETHHHQTPLPPNAATILEITGAMH